VVWNQPCGETADTAFYNVTLATPYIEWYCIHSTSVEANPSFSLSGSLPSTFNVSYQGISSTYGMPQMNVYQGATLISTATASNVSAGGTSATFSFPEPSSGSLGSAFLAVPVIPELAKHLEVHRDGSPASGFIFTGAKMGRPLDLHNLANRIVRPALQKAGIQWCDWHGFRRGLSTNLKTLGVDDLVIQRILRHANVGVTRQSCIKIEDRVKTAAMKKLQGSLSAKIKARKAHKKSVRRRKNKGTLRTNFRTSRHASLVGR
jgi:hypothetical protein